MVPEVVNTFRVRMVVAFAATILSFSAKGAVNYVQLVYQPPPIPGYGSSLPFGVGGWYPLQEPALAYDLNGDGFDDINITTMDRDGTVGTGTVSAAIPLGSSFQLLGAPYLPPIFALSGQAAPLMLGNIIGVDSFAIFDPYFQVQWAGVNFKNGQFNMLFPVIKHVNGPNTQSGTFVGPEVYMGFRMMEADGWHYGWIQMSGDQFYGLVVHGYAYESQANTPLVAGRIPEPSLLWMFGVLLVGRRGQR